MTRASSLFLKLAFSAAAVYLILYATFNTSAGAVTREHVEDVVHEVEDWSQYSIHKHNPIKPSLDTELLAGDSSVRPLKEDDVKWYVDAMVDPHNKTVPRLQCPAVNLTRYEALIPERASRPKVKYMFSFNFHENLPALPRLMATTLEAIRFLGPQNCAISILEGRSTDGTYQVLEALKGEMEALGVRYFLESSFINPYGGDGQHRIERLSALRNLALEPLFQERFRPAKDMKILFINDVELCVEDVLELLFQHKAQDATMSCAMDWSEIGLFYDTWIARTRYGNLFLEITHDESWEHAGDLFFDDPYSHTLYDKRSPLQVYTCWNGATVIDAQPFLENGLRFRAQENEQECRTGEPFYLAKDLWRLGGKHGRIQVVPSVNVAYTTASAEEAKRVRGWVSNSVNTSEPPSNEQTDRVQWMDGPPQLVKCLPAFNQPSWVSSV